MDIRSSLDGLKSLLGVTPAATPPQARTAPAPGAGGLTSDRATLSSAGSEVAQTAADSDVRPEKVASVQAALAAGTYSAPAGAVASKMVDAMLSGNR